MICPTGEAKYFCKRDWTGQISLKNHDKSLFMRGSPSTESGLKCEIRHARAEARSASSR
jgi:hypothetical protein